MNKQKAVLNSNDEDLVVVGNLLESIKDCRSEKNSRKTSKSLQIFNLSNERYLGPACYVGSEEGKSLSEPLTNQEESGSSALLRKTTATWIPHQPATYQPKDAKNFTEQPISGVVASSIQIENASEALPKDHGELQVAIELEPFIHQVGGHNILFRFSNRAVCKPTSERENEFYEYMESNHPELLPFMPKYIGILNVSHHQVDDEELSPVNQVVVGENKQKRLFTYRNSNVTHPEVSLEQNKHILPQWMQSILVGKKPFGKNSKLDASKVINKFEKSAASSSSAGKTSVNRKLQEQVLKEFFKKKEGYIKDEDLSNVYIGSKSLKSKPGIVTRIEKFILIEDLTSEMRKPCVLDLKMGTRQYGINVTGNKKISQMRKCAMTTSKELGVRICGMQVWNKAKQGYIFEDKYSGRKIKAGTEFQSAFLRFLDDGTDSSNYSSTRIKLIPSILEKLKELQEIVNNLKGFRFYASSLLLIYDGDALPGTKYQDKIRVKIIDFAHCVMGSNDVPAEAPCPPSDMNSVDLGYLKGLRSLIIYFARDMTKKCRKRSASEIDRQELSINQLNWRPVDVDLSIDADFHGFGGLEEIEGVEIVKTDEHYKFIRVRHNPPDPVVKLDTDQSQVNDTSSDKETNDTSSDKENSNDQGKNDEILFENLQEWKECGIKDTSLLNFISERGFHQPFPIQTFSMPLINKGFDVISKAATGSGKTLAYLLPIVQYLVSHKPKEPLALIIIPTRELAKQVSDVLAHISKKVDIKSVCLTGGLSIQKQKRLIKGGSDIILGTPGRLWELIVMQELTINTIKFLVIDEADKLLQGGHFKDFEYIMEKIRNMHCQKLLFSATFQESYFTNLKKPANTKKNDLDLLLSKISFKNEVKFVDVDPDKALASQVAERLIECSDRDKNKYLYYFIVSHVGKTLVFVNSIKETKQIAKMLQLLEIDVTVITGTMQQKSRYLAIEKFKSLENGILIATDVAARGLDIQDIKYIIHYSVPHTSDSYVHRSGRTARTGKSGTALLILGGKEQLKFKRLLSVLNKEYKEFQKLNLDFKLMQKLDQRVILAEKILKITMKSSNRDNSWLKEFAYDLGVDLLEKPKKAPIDALEMKQQLKSLLGMPLISKFYAKYITSGPKNIAHQFVKY